MKPIIKGAFVIFLTCLGGLSIAQSSDDIEALSAFLPDGKLSYLQNNNPSLIAEMAYINKHGYYVSDMEGKKDASELPDALLVPSMYENAIPLSEQLITSGNLNLLAYQFSLRHEEHTYYRIGQSGKMLVVLPRKLAQENLRKASVTKSK